MPPGEQFVGQQRDVRMRDYKGSRPCRTGTLTRIRSKDDPP